MTINRAFSPLIHNALTRKMFAVCYPYLPARVRMSKHFWQTYDLLGESQRWTIEQHGIFQLREMRHLLRYAYETVPYYRHVWNDIGVKPEACQNLDDVARFPFTTKSIFQENLTDLLSSNVPEKDRAYVTTGGSTAIPFGFFEERGKAMDREWAFIVRQWERVGYKLGDASVVIRGMPIAGSDRGKYFSLNRLRRELSMSSYHMTDENLPRYLDQMRRFRAPFIQAYPSAITILADYMRRMKIPPFPFLKAILAGSENIYDWQRKLLEEVFQCPVYSWYGHAEKAALGGECEYSHSYHFYPEYGYVELLRSDGKPVTHEGEIGEIIATGFNNLAMPFIRYRTMDMGVATFIPCKCGRNYPLMKCIEGRLQELIVTADNRRISMTAINMHDAVFDNVRQFQFVQEKKGEVVMYIVKKPTYTDGDTRRIQEELGEKLGTMMHLYIQFVDSIPRTASGKFRFLIQKLPVQFHDQK